MPRQELPIIQKSLDLSKELIQRAAKFPKDYKFILGDRIMGHALDIQDCLIRAAYSRGKARIYQMPSGYQVIVGRKLRR